MDRDIVKSGGAAGNGPTTSNDDRKAADPAGAPCGDCSAGSPRHVDLRRARRGSSHVAGSFDAGTARRASPKAFPFGLIVSLGLPLLLSIGFVSAVGWSTPAVAHASEDSAVAATSSDAARLGRNVATSTGSCRCRT